jgi:hypothetical protein
METDTDRNVCGCPVVVDYEPVNGASLSDKYDKMGVTPTELKCRQDGICYLRIIYDKIDNTYEFGELFCTDGEEYAPTRSLLNPTFECVKCMTDFILRGIKSNMEMELRLNGVLIKLLDLLATRNSAKETPANSYLAANKETVNWLETYFSNETMYSNLSTPIKLDKSGNMSLLGVPLVVDSSLGYGIITLMPNILTVDLKIDG